MKIKTVTTTAGVNAIRFNGYTPKYYWIKNLSDATLYVSANPNPVAGADNVSELSAKASTAIETDEGVIYILGAGKVEIHNTDSKLCPFETPGTGSGGGGGSTITVDSSLSDASTNPVQNKVITSALDARATVADLTALEADTNSKLEVKVDREDLANEQKTSAKLMTQIAHPNNYLIYDDLDKPSVMVAIPKFYLDEVISGAEHIVHPAFLVNGVEQNAIYISKYQNVVENDRAYSLPMRDPTVNINFDRSWTCCKNKGAGWHLMTNAEWAAIALWSKKNGTIPKGNNNYGKDVSETALPQKAIAASIGSDGKINRVLTGSGRESWYHDGTYAGIADLNGNIWEWIGDIRLVYGELQIITNAASGECDTSANSADWKAINANATSYDDIFIVPDGSGTTANSVKLDWLSDHWQWQGTSITVQENKTRYAAFASTVCDIDISDFCRYYLQALALLPEDSTNIDNYDNNYFYANNSSAEYWASRGGGWSITAYAGVLSLYFANPRSAVSTNVGARCVYINTSAQQLMATLESDSTESPEMVDTIDNSETEVI